MTRDGDGHKALGDPDESCESTKRDIRRQRQAEQIRESVRRMHYHRYTVGESTRSLVSHSHDADGPEHVHPPRRAFPARADGGYAEESGPSLGTEAPEEVKAHVTRVLVRFLLRERTPDHQLMRWRLRLFCGHVIEATADISYETVEQAFHGSKKCPECGLDPAVIIAAKPVGPVAEPPHGQRAELTDDKASRLGVRLKAAESEVEKLKSEISRIDPR